MIKKKVLEVSNKSAFVKVFYNKEGKIVRITSELEKGMSVLSLINEIHSKIFVNEKLVKGTINLYGNELEIIVD